MSYAEDNGHDIDFDESLLYPTMGNDYDIDSEIVSILSEKEFIWVTKDGKEINIRDMATSHLKNSINLIKKSIDKNKPWRLEFLIPMLVELKQREFCEQLRKMSDEDFNKLVHNE